MLISPFHYLWNLVFAFTQFHLSSKIGCLLLLQDYHRFHSPVSGTIERFVDIPGCLYTVSGRKHEFVCWYFTQFFWYYDFPNILLFFVFFPPFSSKVNPIAVNSEYCNVFTENKRVVAIISTEHFGKVSQCNHYLMFVYLDMKITCRNPLHAV